MNYLVISKINYEILTLEQKSQNSDFKKKTRIRGFCATISTIEVTADVKRDKRHIGHIAQLLKNSCLVSLSIFLNIKPTIRTS